MLIAIGGGIGVGKSAVRRILIELGAKTLSADEINGELLATPDYVKRLSVIFPYAVVNGVPDRKAIRNEIFRNAESKRALDELAHPEIIKLIEEKAKKLGGTVYVEVPLLMERRAYIHFDRLIVVTADRESRIGRVAERDNISTQSAEAILAAQSNEDKAVIIADDIIENDGNFESLRYKIKEIYHKYI